MGNSESSKEQLLDANNYTQLKTINNPFYGEVTVWKNNNSF